MNSSSFDIIETFHNDTVHDIAFDWYGRRLATCSSDQKVKIFNKDSEGKWRKMYEFTAHDAEILKVKWAHPDFGSIIATCSYDKSIIIWEEPKQNIFTETAEIPQDKSTSTKAWLSKTKFFESKEAVLDIEFAPKHQGLILASGTADGYIRIHEPSDILNLQSWRIIAEFLVNPYGINSISWNKNPYDPPMLAIGCKDEQSSDQRDIREIAEQMEEKPGQNQKISLLDKESNHLVVYYNKEGNWTQLSTLPPHNCSDSKVTSAGFHKSAVHCVAWSALNGRSFELLASCGKDGIFIWYLKYSDETKSLKVLRAENLDNKSPVWKVEWNIMGTILASSDQQNSIRLWKNNPGDEKWKCIELIEEDEGK